MYLELVKQQCAAEQHAWTFDVRCTVPQTVDIMPKQQESKRPEIHIDEKWDHVINVTFTRTTLGVLAGLAGGFLLFRGAGARIATTTFFAGCGVGSAYQLCNKEFRELGLPS